MHEPALQTLVYRWRYCADPDPLAHHRIPVSIIRMTSLPHSLHQSLHLILTAECLVLGWRGHLAVDFAANAQHSQRLLTDRTVGIRHRAGFCQGLFDRLKTPFWPVLNARDEGLGGLLQCLPLGNLCISHHRPFLCLYVSTGLEQIRERLLCIAHVLLSDLSLTPIERTLEPILQPARFPPRHFIKRIKRG